MNSTIKRLVYFWLISFATAILGYYLLWLVMPGHQVFGRWFRMLPYHDRYPVQYLFIPCFFYGIIASLYADRFYRLASKKQILSTCFISFITIMISSPIGGMLWMYHDMQAGYFPENWMSCMIIRGTWMGFSIGWLIITLSFPYNIAGLIVGYFLTKTGAVKFRKDG